MCPAAELKAFCRALEETTSAQDAMSKFMHEKLKVDVSAFMQNATDTAAGHTEGTRVHDSVSLHLTEKGLESTDGHACTQGLEGHVAVTLEETLEDMMDPGSCRDTAPQDDEPPQPLAANENLGEVRKEEELMEKDAVQKHHRVCVPWKWEGCTYMVCA